MRRSRYLAVALVGAALTGTGCAGDPDKKTVVVDEGPIGADDRTQIRASNALIKKQGAAAAVLAFIRDVRDGAGPVVFTVYDSRILARVGTSNVISSLDKVRQFTQNAEPVIVRHRRTSAGELVVLRLLRQSEEDRTYSFLLRRQGGRWVIAYDGVLAEGLQAHVQARRAKDPTKPSPAATKAGERAVAALRLAARRPPAGSKPASKRTSSQRNPRAKTPPTAP